MNVIRKYLVPDERVFIPLMVFLSALTLSDITTTISITFSFITVIFIPGNLITYYLLPDSKDKILLSLPAGFGFLPMLAYISGIAGIPLVNPIVPIITSILSLALMYYRKEVLRIL